LAYQISQIAFRFWWRRDINPLKTKHRLLYLKTQSVPRSKHFSSRLWNQSFFAICGRRRCLFWD